MKSVDLFICSRAEEYCLSTLHCALALPYNFGINRKGQCEFDRTKETISLNVLTINYEGDIVDLIPRIGKEILRCHH
jgi:hypothetical protein